MLWVHLSVLLKKKQEKKTIASQDRENERFPAMVNVVIYVRGIPHGDLETKSPHEVGLFMSKTLKFSR